MLAYRDVTQKIVFECFHNFVAFSQWGNSLYNVVARLDRDGGDPQTEDWHSRTMSGPFDSPDGSAFPPPERFVMELVRTISRTGEAFPRSRNHRAAVRAAPFHGQPAQLHQPRSGAVGQPGRRPSGLY
ncbi:hypothetical protein [Mycobacterium sp. 155]|uniref:hypothetical protein n=1 Tax=Mycobacterium sp. 155 TaxID=1157943 RepID=UPI00039C57B9|nr:hypothetical protein [Mycobacterium sp. 155]